MNPKISKLRSLSFFLAALLFAAPLLCLPANATDESSYYGYAGTIGEASDPEDGYMLGNPVAISEDTFGSFYVADLANNRIVKLNSSMEKVATIENIDLPIFVYVDNSNNILVSEMGTNRILKYSQSLELVAYWGGGGTGNGEFNIPRSIVQDSYGYYYVSDELNHRIQKFTESGVFVASYGSYGDGSGEFRVQQGISIDSSNRIYVADTYNNRIQVFQTYPAWQYLTSFGTYGVYNPFNYFSFQPGIMNHPRGVYVDRSSGKVVVTDSSNNRVMVYNSYESGFSFYESQNGYLSMSLPSHAIRSDGFLIVLDSHSRILKYYSALNNTYMFTEHDCYRYDDGTLSNPQSVCVEQSSGNVYVSDSFNHRVQVFSAGGTYIRDYGGIGGPYGYGTALGYFLYPKQLTFDDDGTLYVADFGNSRVVKKAANETTFSVAVSSSRVTQPWGVAVDDSGYLYVSDWYDNTVKVVYNGVTVSTWGGTGTSSGYFNKPCDLKLGTYDGGDALFVADCGNSRVQVFSLDGTYLDELGTPAADPLCYYNTVKAGGGLLLPYGVTIDSEGRILVADTSHKCMRVYSSGGTLLETWGTMSNSDGNFFSPMGCDVNLTTGRLYIADGVLERIQYFDLTAP